MASAGLLLQLTIILITVEGAFTDFVNVACIENQSAQVGQETLLKCVVKASAEAENLIRIIGVQWQKSSRGSSEWGTVLEVQEEKQSASEGYSLADPLWRSGKKNMSLLISNTAVKHDGVYRCAVATSAGNGYCPSVNLNVTAKYTDPTVHFTEEKSSDVKGILTCTSRGYPQGKLRWFDEDGKDWTRSANTSSKEMEDGRIELSSQLTVMSGSDFSFTCAVFDHAGSRVGKTTSHKSERTISGPDANKQPVSANVIATPLVVIGSLIVGLLLLVLLLRWKRRQNEPREDPLDVEQGDCDSRRPLEPND